jgi:steroid delta-isomerase-like uncharacterized protein
MKPKFLWIAVAAISLPTILHAADEPSRSKAEAHNVEVVRRAHEALNQGDVEAFAANLSPNYVRHCQAMPPELQELHGTKEFLGFIQAWLQAVPDHHDTLSQIVADGDRVAYVETLTGTQVGPLGDLPATGKKFELANIVIQRLEDGKIVETWVSWDNMAFLRQIGMMPGTKP